ncbi:hypothetical protein ILUMI_00028 [Ignelater luminosus]|uniref:PiggyBac transposable element-derived protein domain-containing protein n=1 Tax=Ignelater luminosus TaxID=2038154 RepID=A0A8K0GQN1_IGNLU|nr:hypothetical protein ILUMI_00028 [Ignelater luminosus]
MPSPALDVAEKIQLSLSDYDFDSDDLRKFFKILQKLKMWKKKKGEEADFALPLGTKLSSGERKMRLTMKVCLELLNGLLDEERTLFLGNFYTTYELAKELLEKSTHLVGTYIVNRKDFPKKVVCLKWKEARIVRLLSIKQAPILPLTNTAHTPSPIINQNATSIAQNPKKREKGRTSKRPATKSLAVLAYNKGKSDVKWYRKLRIELLLETSVVNAWFIYKLVTKKEIQI